MEGAINFILKYLTFIVGSIILSVVLWLYSPEDSIPIIWFIYITLPIAFLAIMLLDIVAKNFFQKKQNTLPKLRTIHEDICIFEPSDIFSSQAFVSIYHIDKVERLAAWGKIETVQDNSKNLQVIVKGFANNYDQQQLNRERKNIMLKPTIPYNIIEQLFLTPADNKDEKGDSK